MHQPRPGHLHLPPTRGIHIEVSAFLPSSSARATPTDEHEADPALEPALEDGRGSTPG